MMNEEVVERYLNLVPLEIREAFNALSSDQRWAVYIALTAEGRKYFNELKEQFGANPNTMAPILKDLVNSGLVARKVQTKDIGDRRKIYYEPTAVGTNLLTTVYDDLLPEYPQQSMKNPHWLSLKDFMPFYKHIQEINIDSTEIKKIGKMLQEIYIADRIDMENWNNTLEQNRLHGPESARLKINESDTLKQNRPTFSGSVGQKIGGPYGTMLSSAPQYAEVKND